MQEAQGRFRQVVQTELSSLLKKGISRPEAVKILLKRIVVEDYHPSEAEIDMVSLKFQLNPEDATRALIVKHELARLKRCGMDSLGAIEYLTQHVKLDVSRSTRPITSNNSAADVRTCSSSSSSSGQENTRNALASTLAQPNTSNESSCQHVQASSGRKRRYPTSPQQYMNVLAAVSNSSENFSSSYGTPFKKSKHPLKVAVGSSSNEDVDPALDFEAQGPLRANILRETTLPSGINKRTRQQSEIDMVDIESGFANVSVEDRKRKCIAFPKSAKSGNHGRK